jgi:hypothetical protein
VTSSLAQLYFIRSFCGGDSSFAPLQPGRTQLSSFDLLKNRHYLFVDIRPKMIFRSLPAYFISDQSFSNLMQIDFQCASDVSSAAL